MDKAKMRQCNRCADYFDPSTLDGAVHLASCRIYNGYKNYETWCVSLWLDNDSGSYTYWRDAARTCREEAEENRNPLRPTSLTVADVARYKLAAQMREEIREQAEEGIEGMAADLLGSAFDEVDWNHLAEGFLEE